MSAPWRRGAWVDDKTWAACEGCARPAMCAGWSRCERDILLPAAARCETCVDRGACARDGCAALRDVLRGKAA